MSHPLVLIPENLKHPSLAGLESRYGCRSDPELWRDRKRLLEAVVGIEAILVRNQTQVDQPLIEAATRLKIIGRVGVGLDNIDLQCARERGVVVVAPLEANAISVAELTMGLILSLARKLPQADRATRNGTWDRVQFTGLELHGKTVALLGFGRISKLVAARALAFGMKVQTFDPFLKSAPEQVQLFSEMGEAVEKADFVSVHVPLNPATRGMCGSAFFRQMKAGSFFINTSRGGVMDEVALIQGLQSRHLAGAALDVREVEPPGERSALEKMENVILTPHIGAFTVEAQDRTFQVVVRDVEKVLSGQPPLNQVP